MKNYSVLSLGALLFFITFSFGQNKIIGKVVNSKYKPISNAIIYLDSINSNVKTDKKGFFEVEVAENVKYINVYSNKYGLLSCEYNGESKVDFIFIDGKISSKDRLKEGENISIGYIEDEKKYITYKVESIDAEKQFDAVGYTTIYDLLRGRFPGVRVTNNNEIIIRGVSSLIVQQPPLFVVDGFEIPSIAHILPVNVKSIRILKSGASYGIRGANGVILITTKD